MKKLGLLLVFFAAILTSCKEKVVVKEVQSYKISVDTAYRYKVRTEEGVYKTLVTTDKFKNGDTTEMYK